jgi:hypothetical protein
MADYEKIEITTKRVIYRVKGPTPWAELGKAIQAARQDCAKVRDVPVEKLFDNDVMVQTFDQDIHVYYEVEVKPT